MRLKMIDGVDYFARRADQQPSHDRKRQLGREIDEFFA
jgi:hypothetical protein